MNNKISVLYLDDEPINLELFVLTFSHVYNILTAISGAAGLEILKKHPEITIVISDMKMPEMSGLEFIKKAQEIFPNIFYFILTGFDISPEISEALDVKLINAYFSKPLDIERIEDSITEVLDAK